MSKKKNIKVLGVFLIIIVSLGLVVLAANRKSSVSSNIKVVGSANVSPASVTMSNIVAPATSVVSDTSVATTFQNTKINVELAKQNNKKVDIDLSDDNITMRFGGLSNILNNPVDNLGKVVKIKGTYLRADDNIGFAKDKKGTFFPVLLVKDKMGCCTVGVEFRTIDDKFPKDETTITIVGTFSTYKDANNETFYRLDGCQIE